MQTWKINLKNYKLLLWHDIPGIKVSYQSNTLKRSKAALKLVELLQPAVLDTCNIKNFQIVIEQWPMFNILKF